MSARKLPYSILFVDDEVEIRSNYILYLQTMFSSVYEAGCGKSAYKIYKEKKPDIMVIDINMPNMSGLELLRKIRQLDHNVKAIMLTGYSQVEYVLDASELKIVKYLIKPIERLNLKEALDLAIHELQNFETIAKLQVPLRDGFVWHTIEKQLLKDGLEIELSPKERLLCELFFQNINMQLTYDDIMLYVWNDFSVDNTYGVRELVKKLRKKLPAETISNVYGIGFRVNI